MSRGGQAYLVYRVVTDARPANPPGYVGADTRVARYNGRLWSVLGTPVDRKRRRRRCGPRPRTTRREVGIDVQGSGVVAWQEPDDEFVDRVWARRLFGTNVGIPLQVSPSSWDGAPLRGPRRRLLPRRRRLRPGAPSPSASSPGQASKLDAPRVFVNEMPDVFAEPAAAVRRARLLVDGGVRGALGAAERRRRPARPLRGRLRAGRGDPARLRRRQRRPSASSASTTGGSGVAGDPLVDLAETGAAVAAWRELRGGAGLGGRAGAPRRRGRRADRLSAPRGGAVGGIDAGRLGPRRRDRRLAAGRRRQRPDRRRGGRRAARPVPRPAARAAGSASGGSRIAWDRSPNAIGACHATRSASTTSRCSRACARLQRPARAATTSTTAATGSRSSRSTPRARRPAAGSARLRVDRTRAAGALRRAEGAADRARVARLAATAASRRLRAGPGRRASRVRRAGQAAQGATVTPACATPTPARGTLPRSVVRARDRAGNRSTGPAAGEGRGEARAASPPGLLRGRRGASRRRALGGRLLRQRRADRLGRLRARSSRATTPPSSPRSPPTAATSRSRPAPATSSPTTTPTRRASTAPAGIFRFDLDTQGAASWSPTATCSTKRRTRSCFAAPATRRSAPTAASSPSPPPQPLVRRRHATTTSTSTCATWRSPIGGPGAFDLVSARDGGDVAGELRRRRPVHSRERTRRRGDSRGVGDQRRRAARSPSAPTSPSDLPASRRPGRRRPARSSCATAQRERPRRWSRGSAIRQR